MASEPDVFKPKWPDGLVSDENYTVMCDDKGANGGSYATVFIDQQGDVYLSMQDWEDIPEGRPTPFPSIRVRSLAGGGRNPRTRQALLWLADAIRRDNEENGTGATS